MVPITEPTAPDSILASFPPDDFPRYVWMEKPAGLPAEGYIYRPSDREALEAALERYQGGTPIEPTTWIRAVARAVALAEFDKERQTGMEWEELRPWETAAGIG